MRFVVVFLITVLATVAVQEDWFNLTIIHYNDFHARFEEVSPDGAICEADEECIGGFARLYTAITQAFEAEPDSLLLNGGDTFQGTIWFNILKWNVTQHFMNMLPHDAHTIGNHEFDHGIDGLVPYLERLNSPMLGANVNTTFEPTMAPYIKNHVVVERKGRKIGIIGVLLRDFTAPIGGVIIEDELEAVNREAAILTEQGVDIIILLSHIGYDNDLEMAKRMAPEVDIIVGAHSHTLLFNGDSPSGDTTYGPYPTVVTKPNGRKVIVVQAACCTRYLGNIKIFIDKSGVVQDWVGKPVFLDTSIVQDPYILEQLSSWKAQVDSVGKEILGTSLVQLARGCYSGECVLGSWACDGFLEKMMESANESAWNSAHVCLINAGGLRNHLNPGIITTEALLMAMPFENYLQVFDIKGKYILEALEFSVGVPQDTPGQFYSQKMVQVGGIRVVYNASAPIGSRVVSLLVRCIQCDVPRYTPLDPDITYRMVAQNYIGEGGSGFTMLSDNRQNVTNVGLDYVVLQEYMRRQRVVIKDLDGRIQIVY